MGRGFVFLTCVLAATLANSQEFTSSNLPIVVINTNGQEIPDEPKITAHMGIIDNGPGVRNNLDDPFNNYDGIIGIEIRGSSSQMFPKKQYGIELRDEFGDGIDAPLMGLPPEEDWVLFAPYNDRSLMRDVLAYKLAADGGRYAPRTKYCEVVLNGEYMGVYVLIEKIKRDPNRVNINKLNPDEITGNDVTGGYMLKLDKIDPDESGWTSDYPPNYRASNQQILFIYETPKTEDIVPQQKSYIQLFIKAFENALAGPNYKDPVEGYAKYIDVGSFIDYYLVNEISKNVDGYRISTFMHKQRDSDGGKLHMGPVWDYNLGFGNVNYCTNGDPGGFITDFNKICPQDYWLIPFWWERLEQDPSYQQQLNERWEELRAGPYSKNNINHFIDSIASLLNEEAQQRNFERWPTFGQYIWPNYFIGDTFDEEVTWMKSWLNSRIDWLDQNLPTLIVNTGSDGAETRPTISAYPNPFDNNLTVRYATSEPCTVEVQVRDGAGRLVSHISEYHNEPGKKTLDLPTHSISPGMYFLTLQIGEGTTQIIKVIRN